MGIRSAVNIWMMRAGYILAALLLSTLSILHDTRHFYFFSDDFLHFTIAREMGFTCNYLMRDVFGQFIPLYRLGFLAYWHVFGVHFWPFRVCCVLANWTIILTIWVVGKERKIRDEILLILSVVIATDPVFATNYQWASVALTVTGSTLPGLMALAVAATPHQLTWKKRAALAALFAVALLLYPKALFLAILIGAVRTFVLVQGVQVKTATIVRAVTIDILPCMILAVIYAAIVQIGGYTSGVVRPNIMVLISFIARGWNHGLLTMVLGLSTGSKLQLVIANGCVAILLGASVYRNWKTIVLWAGFAAYFLTSIGVIGWNRAVPWGLESADTARYYADIFCYGVMFAILAFAPRPGSVDSRSSPRTWLLASAACVVGALYFLRASAMVPHLWYAGPEKPAEFVAHVRSSLDKLGPTDTIANSTVPTYVMPAWMFPYTQYDKFLPIFGFRGRVVRESDASYAFDGNGGLIRLTHGHARATQ